MSNSHKKTIFITGASGSIGQALALIYAGPDVILILHARNVENLKKLTKQCQELGAELTCVEFDCEDIKAVGSCVESRLSGFDIDLAILNAGANDFPGNGEIIEKTEISRRVLAINLQANVELTTLLIPRMKHGGQIALMSSLAAFYGLPLTPAYSASKAGLKAYGEALRPNLANVGIKLSVVMPGYISSKMCHAMPGPKPFLRSPEYAAQKIQSGLARNKARIAFPLPLVFGAWLLAAVPSGLANILLRLFGYSQVNR